MLDRLCTRPAFLAAILGGLAGCAGEAVAPAEPARDPAKLFWELTLNQNAVNLSTAAPYDTFRLVATPRRADGTPIAGMPTPQFESKNPQLVLVSPDGLVRGLAATNQTLVIVTMEDSAGNLTHEDTALVSVTTNPTPPVVARISLEPSPADSAKGPMTQSTFVPYYPLPRLVVHGFDAQENPIAISNLSVWIESSDPLTARYDNRSRRLFLDRPGSVRFVARVAAYGQELADTLEYTVGLPVALRVIATTYSALGGTVTRRFNPSTITVAAGGHVHWWRTGGVPRFDVTFDDPANVAADQLHSANLACGGDNLVGNITQFGDSTTFNPLKNICSRHFPVPGTYTYHSDVLGASGTIVVVDESQAPATARLGFGSH